MKWYFEVLKKYADFSGRASRKEYWLFLLYNIFFHLLLIMVDLISNLTSADLMDSGYKYGLFSTTYYFIMLLPSFAVAVRRLHDTGHSAWFMFFFVIPFVGAIWIFVLMLTKGSRGDNIYGANPSVKTNEWNSEKSCCNIFLIASLISLVLIVVDIINNFKLTSEINFYDYLQLIFPVSLYLIGIFLYHGEEGNKKAAWSILVFIIYLLIGNVKNLVGFFNDFEPNFILAYTLDYTPIFLVIIGLLFAGIWLLKGKGAPVAAELLILGALCMVIKELLFSYSNVDNPKQFFIGKIGIIVSMAYFIFGYSLMQKKHPVGQDVYMSVNSEV